MPSPRNTARQADRPAGRQGRRGHAPPFPCGVRSYGQTTERLRKNYGTPTLARRVGTHRRAAAQSAPSRLRSCRKGAPERRRKRSLCDPSQAPVMQSLIGFSTGYPQGISSTYPPQISMLHCFSLARLAGDCERPLTATDRKTPGGAQGLRVTWAERSGFGPVRTAKVTGTPVDRERSSDRKGSLVSQGPERAAAGPRTLSGCDGSMNHHAGG